MKSRKFHFARSDEKGEWGGAYDAGAELATGRAGCHAGKVKDEPFAAAAVGKLVVYLQGQVGGGAHAGKA